MQLCLNKHYDPWGLNLAGIERQGTPDHLFQYNGKEKQTELGLNWMDYGARMYDAQLGRFHVQDRFAEKYINFTPYQYGGNNPVLYIDVNGDSLAIFKNGKWVATVDDGKKEITGFNQRSTKNKKGEEVFTGADRFSFNDYEDDMAGIRSGDLTLRFVSDSEISGLMEKSGVTHSENRENAWTYIERESRPIGNRGALTPWKKSSGNMDYQKYPNKDNWNSLNIINGIAYNNADYGNFLWGMGGRRLGFSYRTLLAASHLNNAFNSHKDNPDKSYSVMDSPGDQRAIKNGYNYWIKKPKGLPRE